MINANLVIVHMDHFSVTHFIHKTRLSLHAHIAHVWCHSPVAGGMEQIASLCEAAGRRNYHICGWHPLLSQACNYLNQSDSTHRVGFILDIRRIAYEVWSTAGKFPKGRMGGRIQACVKEDKFLAEQTNFSWSQWDLRGSGFCKILSEVSASVRFSVESPGEVNHKKKYCVASLTVWTPPKHFTQEPQT